MEERDELIRERSLKIGRDMIRKPEEIIVKVVRGEKF